MSMSSIIPLFVPIGRCGHEVTVHAAEGVVVGHRRLLQQLAVHGRTHDERFVDGLHGLVRRGAGGA